MLRELHAVFSTVNTQLSRKRRIMSASTGCRCSCCNQTGSQCSLEVSEKFILVFYDIGGCWYRRCVAFNLFSHIFFTPFTVIQTHHLAVAVYVCVSELFLRVHPPVWCCDASPHCRCKASPYCADYRRCFYSLWDYDISGLLLQHINA